MTDESSAHGSETSDTEQCDHPNTNTKREPEYPSIPAASGQTWYYKTYCTECGKRLSSKKARYAER